MTPRECARLQSMASLELPEAPTRAYEALGNAVNVRIAEEVAIQLLGERRRQSCSEADQSVHQTSFIGQSISENGDVLDSSIAGTMAIVT